MYSYLELENKIYEDLYIKFCGMQECTPNYSFGPAIRTHYLIHYCLSGKGEYHVKDKIYTILPGDAFLIMPNVVTYYQADNKDPWTYFWIGFDGNKAKQILNYCGLDNENLVVHSDCIDELKEIGSSMLSHYNSNYSNEMFIQDKLFEFFSYFAQNTDIKPEEKNNINYNPYINKAIEYIQNNYQNFITVQNIADYLSLNRSYLTVLFKQHLHMSPQEFLLKYRMQQAENLLMNTNLPINQIAYSCGYATQFAFSKAFHNIHNISPRDFRKRFKLNNRNSRTEDPHHKELYSKKQNDLKNNKDD
ncbi:MAG: AraC family transcriptional regulator [Intestinibacter sp.]|uniref:AraC family transcriptional regulator n=1 Tax=Intestinibacter sp. TaxID=1965304 RepID=UPI003F162EBD